jgi:hypothetical protein
MESLTKTAWIVNRLFEKQGSLIVVLSVEKRPVSSPGKSPWIQTGGPVVKKTLPTVGQNLLTRRRRDR